MPAPADACRLVAPTQSDTPSMCADLHASEGAPSAGETPCRSAFQRRTLRHFGCRIHIRAAHIDACAHLA
jgi:hypothetical protein